MKTYFLKASAIAFAVIAMSACCNKTSVIGEWVEPIPGMEGVQGFKLEEGGKASSINMATLQIESWEQKGNNLILSGQSIGNGQTIAFSDTLEITRQTSDSLILKSQGVEMVYTLQK